jgi:nicotinate-nucleotide adenylyltransferase
MRIAIFGGTFNPIHIGHLFMAEDVRVAFGYDRILFVPTHRPVHKEVKDEVGPERRLEMLRIAVAAYPELGVDDVELRRGGSSYTIDTIYQIMRPWSLDGKLGMIIGDDLARNFHTWKEPEVLARLVDLIVVHRETDRRIEIEYPHQYIDNVRLPISSTMIRNRIRGGQPVRFLVPDEVLRYIERNRLYR